MSGYSKIVISTRRFLAIPSFVELSAIGLSLPHAFIIKRAEAIPRLESSFAITAARSFESSSSPVLFPVDAE